MARQISAVENVHGKQKNVVLLPPAWASGDHQVGSPNLTVDPAMCGQESKRRMRLLSLSKLRNMTKRHFVPPMCVQQTISSLKNTVRTGVFVGTSYPAHSKQNAMEASN